MNRLLALLLFADALDLATSGAVLGMLHESPDVVAQRAKGLTHFTADSILVAAYLAFLGEALQTPLVRPARTTVGRFALAAAAVAAYLLVVAARDARDAAGRAGAQRQGRSYHRAGGRLLVRADRAPRPIAIS